MSDFVCTLLLSWSLLSSGAFDSSLLLETRAFLIDLGSFKELSKSKRLLPDFLRGAGLELSGKLEAVNWIFENFVSLRGLRRLNSFELLLRSTFSVSSSFSRLLLSVLLFRC